MIDTSDGLVRDAARVGSASGVVLDLDLALLTPALLTPAAGGALEDLRVAAELLGDPSLVPRWVLTGGEDHALLACFGPGTTLPAGFRAVGEVREVPARQTSARQTSARQTSAGQRSAGQTSAGQRSAGQRSAGEPGVLVDGRPWRGESGWHHWA
jgi:thiamine-monophosphate kinase